MTEKLNRIKSVLNQVIKDGKKVNTGNIIGAIGDLEQFPMTKALLQSTRVGKVLNEVRKLTSGTLPNRIKAIIRAWQILLHDAAKSDTVVVPIKAQNGTNHCQSPAINCLTEDNSGYSKTKLKRVNGSTASLPVLDSLMQDGKNSVGSPSSPASSVTSNLAERNNHVKRSFDDSKLSKKRYRFSNQVSSFDAGTSLDSDGRSPPNKCLRLQNADLSTNYNVSGNGGSELQAAGKSETGKSSVHTSVVTSNDSVGTSIPKLRIRFGGNGKSSSTSVIPNCSNKSDNVVGAPVLSPGVANSSKNFQLLSRDVDPQGDTLSAVSGSTNRSSRQQPVANPAALPRVKSTAELLIQYGSEIKSQKKTNILEIEREPDLVPSVLPESARPRRLRAMGPSVRNKTHGGSTSASSSQDLLVIDSPASFKRGKTSILEKFLASAVKYSDNDESDKDNSNAKETATYAVTNFVVNSAAASAPVTSPPMSVPSHQLSPESTSKPVLPCKTRFDSTNLSTDKVENSETDAATEDLELKRRHHKHKHKHKHKVKNKHKVSHPITNLMDRRPLPLPPLPDVDPAKYPYPIPKPVEANKRNVDRLLHTTWEGMNCGTHGDTGESMSYTEMYTLGLRNAANNPPDSVLHMLPWVDLNGWRRQYFPENALKYIDEFQLAKPR